jgi:hypothetical protein
MRKQHEKNMKDGEFMAAIQKKRRLIDVSLVGFALDHSEGLVMLIPSWDTPPSATDQVLFYGHLRSLEGVEKVEDKPVVLTGWKAEQLMNMRVKSLAAIAARATGAEREALLQEIARICTAAEITSECKRVAELDTDDQMNACALIADGIVQRIGQLPDGGILVVPLRVPGHQMYMNVERKGEKIILSIDNLGVLGEDHVSDQDGKRYPYMIPGIDPVPSVLCRRQTLAEGFL